MEDAAIVAEFVEGEEDEEDEEDFTPAFLAAERNPVVVADVTADGVHGAGAGAASSSAPPPTPRENENASNSVVEDEATKEAKLSHPVVPSAARSSRASSNSSDEEADDSDGSASTDSDLPVAYFGALEDEDVPIIDETIIKVQPQKKQKNQRKEEKGRIVVLDLTQKQRTGKPLTSADKKRREKNESLRKNICVAISQNVVVAQSCLGTCNRDIVRSRALCQETLAMQKKLNSDVFGLMGRTSESLDVLHKAIGMVSVDSSLDTRRIE